ncbi:MAG: RluA family pseudouridine synthase [Rubrivivax sp.]
MEGEEVELDAGDDALTAGMAVAKDTAGTAVAKDTAGTASTADIASDAGAAIALDRRSAVVAPGQHGQRLDKVLVALAPEFSRSHLQHLVEGGHVRVGAAAVRVPARRLRAGDEVVLELVPTEESRAFTPQPMALAIVHEDDDLIVLVKPAGLVVHPAAGNWSGTLLNGLLAHHAGAAALPRAGIVHRLDKDTSGLMLVGKTLAAVTALVRDIAARHVHRSYLALAWGEVPAAQTIEAPIGRDPRSRTRMAVVPVGSGGREARTDVQCLASAVVAEEGGTGGTATRASPVSALRCTLHSGRTHQIRVHLASRGWPLVADVLYGGRPGLGLTRQALHAVRLELAHPTSRRPLVFTAAPPRDFAQAWARVAGATMPAD